MINARLIPLILSLVALAISFKVVEEGKAELLEEIEQLNKVIADQEKEIIEYKKRTLYYQDKVAEYEKNQKTN